MLTHFFLLLILYFHACFCVSLPSLPSLGVVEGSEAQSWPSTLTLTTRSPSPSQSRAASPLSLLHKSRERSGTIVRRIQSLINCQPIERTYLECMLNGDVREILNAGAYTASGRGLWSRRKFREFFGVYTRERAEEVRNWLMGIEIERHLTLGGGGNFELYCRRDEFDEDPLCGYLMPGYVWRWRGNRAPNILALYPRFWESLIQGNGQLIDNEALGEKYMLRVLLALLLETDHQPFERLDDVTERFLSFITVQGFRAQLFATKFIPGLSDPETKIKDTYAVMEYAISVWMREPAPELHPPGITYYGNVHPP